MASLEDDYTSCFEAGEPERNYCLACDYGDGQPCSTYGVDGEASPSAENVTVESALRRFGWTCGPDFEKRYYTDPWVFNLANAVETLTRENERLRSALAALERAVHKELEGYPMRLTTQEALTEAMVVLYGG